jgi:hypothetical protein
MSDTSFTADPVPPFPPATPPAAAPAAEIKKKSSRLPLILLALAASHLIVLIVGAGIGFGISYLAGDRRVDPAYESVAVLPITGDWQPVGHGNNWAEHRREYLEMTLPDSLSAKIAANTTGSVKVRATHDLRNVVPQQAPRTIGTAINVRTVLSGQVSKEGRLNLQLISVNSGELLWSGSYMFVQVDPAPRWGLPGQIEAEISQAVANRLMGRK